MADISRSIGNSRQSVQRVADLLVDQGLAECRPNPTHADLAGRLRSEIGEERQLVEHLTRLQLL